MTLIATARELIALWPDATVMAEEVKAAPATVRGWAFRGTIDEANWAQIITAAQARADEDPRFGMVNAKLLHSINEAARAAKREAPGDAAE